MMYGLSLLEPWAKLHAKGFKGKETRSWATPYRKDFALHASKGKEAIKEWEDVEILFEDAGIPVPDWWPRRPEDYALGCIIAVSRVIDCQKMDEKLIAAQTPEERAFGAWAPGRFAWFLGQARELAKPVPCKGSLGFWKLPPEVEAQIRAQLGEEVPA